MRNARSTGANEVNNTIGQALLARRMGKKRVIAETGAGQHGVASATVAARFGMTCDVYMGADDIQRQMPNVFRMKLLGANVVSVDSGSRTLKDAMNEAMREWVARVDDTFYIIGTAADAGSLTLPWPAWAVARTPSACSTRISAKKTCALSAWKRADAARTPPTTPRRLPAKPPSAYCTASAAT